MQSTRAPLYRGTAITRRRAPPLRHRSTNRPLLPSPPRAGGGARLSRRPAPPLVAAPSTSNNRQREDNPLTVGLVAVLTESLRLLGVGQDRFEEADAAPEQPRPKKNDIDAVRRRIADDFSGAYFVVGQLDDGIYDPQCRFADPTVAFRGVRLWRRNLALLTPFLVEPRIDLLPPTAEDEEAAAAAAAAGPPRRQSPLLLAPLFGGLFGGGSGGKNANDKNGTAAARIVRLGPLFGGLFGGGSGGKNANDKNGAAAARIVRLGPVGPSGEQVLRARWFLETGLRLPWRPAIAIKGSTDYTLDLEESNRVIDHVESWEVSGTEALLQLFRPGGAAVRGGGG